MTEWVEQEARFFDAVNKGEVETVRDMARQYPVLLKARSTDADGMGDKYALHLAVRAENPAMVDALIELGADMEAGDTFGVTPLMHAAQCKGAAVAKLLLEKGADPFHNTQDNMTPLMFAAMAGNTDAVETFLQHGIGVNARRDCGMVALHFARDAKNRLQTVCLLVDAGADTTLTNVAHETPAMLAARMGDKTYADTITAALRQKEIRDTAKALTDQKDREVLKNGLPEAFAVRRSPLRLAVKS